MFVFCAWAPLAAMPGAAPPPLAAANENRAPAGQLESGVLTLHLVARTVDWQPERDPNRALHVLAFSEVGKEPQIPGPLLRVPQGTEVRISVRNAVDPATHIGLPPARQRVDGTDSIAGSELSVHGLSAGTAKDDVLHVPVGETRQLRFRADRPGTFLYWGAMSRRALDSRTTGDSQLTGAIIVDPAGVRPDPGERIFVITMLDSFPDPSKTPPGQDRFKPVINGLSWPHTERFRYARGETVRWRWINGSFSEHPMHLHGFHFRILARGDARSETIYPQHEVQDAVTELMEPGATMRMAWVPTRPGNWLMHCHLRDHVTPSPERKPEERAHDLHDVERHPLTAMAGLILGITVSDDGSPASETDQRDQLRLLAREERISGTDRVRRGFLVTDDSPSLSDRISVPGPPIILSRGRTASIEVVNEMSEPTTVHWHGMELESVYDGVAGWSRRGSRVAPLLAPGASFRVQMTPPRAGTFIYHTHMDETDQLVAGLYGPLIVLEPGAKFNPALDRVYVIGGSMDASGVHSVTVNGALEPPPQAVRASATYRLRFINITPDATVEMRLVQDDGLQRWTAIANDGADLPAALRVERPAELRFGPGQTYDFEWTPAAPGNAALLLDWQFPTEHGSLSLRQAISVLGN